jgi:hypothetical protein
LVGEALEESLLQGLLNLMAPRKRRLKISKQQTGQAAQIVVLPHHQAAPHEDLLRGQLRSVRNGQRVIDYITDCSFKIRVSNVLPNHGYEFIWS